MRPVRILFVCTGNVFRSPTAQAFLGAMALDRGIAMNVKSAGTLPGARSVSPDALEVIGAEGLDMSRHRSRPLEARAIAGADLVVGMAREHVREVVLLDPGAWGRTFTLKELVRRGEAVGARAPGRSLAGWLELVGEGRIREDVMGWSPLDDVEDPMDRGPAACREVGEEIHDLVLRLFELIEPLA